MASIAEALETAATYHREGQLDEAERVYRLILDADPGHAETLHRLGIVAGQAGRLQEAESLLRRAAAAAPEDGRARNSLAVVLNQQGRIAESAEMLREVARLLPRDGLCRANLGSALESLGREDEAAECYRDAIRLQPHLPAPHYKLGALLIRQGRMPEGEAAIEEAVRLAPRSPDAPQAAAEALHREGRLGKAAAYYTRALDVSPDLLAPRLNLGQICQRQGKLDEALMHFREARRRAAREPGALLAVASRLQHQGRLDEAVEVYQEVLRFQPDCAAAFHGLAEFVKDGRYQFTEDELNRLRGLLDRGGLDPAAENALAFALAYTLDRAGDADAAFPLFRRGNEAKREALRRAGRVFDPEENRRLTSQAIATFTPAYFERVKGFGLDSDRPIFIVGMPRSGTTLVEQMLASHPRVFGAGEVMHVPRAVAGLAARLGGAAAYPGCMGRISAEAVRAEAQRYLDRVAEFAGEADRVTDKLPENFFHLGTIATLFPKARVIHCVRDALDVCLSCYQQNFAESSFTLRLDDLAAYHRQYERLMAHWRAALPLPMLDVRYEELVAEPQRLTREMVAFCGLDWDDRCLSSHETRRAVDTASQFQVRRPVYTDSVGRWRRYAKHLGPLMEALARPA